MIYITYSIRGSVDGPGSQYQKLITTICLASYYGFQYVNDFNPDAMEHIDIEYKKKIDHFFGLKNNFKESSSLNYDEEYEIDFNNNSYILEEFIQKKNSTNKNVLLKIKNAYIYSFSHPEIFDAMPFLRSIRTSLPLIWYNPGDFNIVIHVRRGDVSENQNNINRYVSTTEVEKYVSKLCSLYPHGVIYIMTEIDETNKHEFDDIIHKYSVRLIANEDIVDTWNHMIRADVLVMTLSSFSYICSLYNENIVYYKQMNDAKLSHWKDVKELLEDQNVKEGFDNRNDFLFVIFVIIIIILCVIILKLRIFKKSWFY